MLSQTDIQAIALAVADILTARGIIPDTTVGVGEAAEILERGREWIRRNDDWLPHTGTGKGKRYDRATLIKIKNNGYTL
ncbi:MAG: hypothetical protein HUK08_00215 [Bacteroidaceae bacterium]|nr:hypothetical protein [Bacteroidaceae bacterium]